MATDFLRAAITKHLAPVMTRAGFHRHTPKTFVRVRGDVVHGIGFQVSQWGGKDFYLHRSLNLLTFPLMLPDTYRVGARIDGAEGEAAWHAADAEAADAALQGVVRVVQAEVLPWFDTVATARDFIAEFVAEPSSTLQSLELCVALLRMGATDRAHHICTLLSSPNGYMHEPTERDRRQMDCCREALAAIESGTVQELLDRWRDENIRAHGLDKALAVA